MDFSDFEKDGRVKDRNKAFKTFIFFQGFSKNRSVLPWRNSKIFLAIKFIGKIRRIIEIVQSTVNGKLESIHFLLRRLI